MEATTRTAHPAYLSQRPIPNCDGLDTGRNHYVARPHSANFVIFYPSCDIIFYRNDIGGFMIRTVISLNDSDKLWLDQQAALQHVPMTEVVRQAVQAMRASRQQSGDDFLTLLANTSGIWHHGDGLAWQKTIREEWSR
jgi:hypothetical protein